MWFDDIYVNNTALDAPYVSDPLAYILPSSIHQLFCGRHTLDKVSQQTLVLV